MDVEHSSGRACEVAVVGAGAVGLTLALGLARAGLKTELVGSRSGPRPGRTVALLAGSVRLLESLGVWPDLARLAAPMASMRIVDATGSLFRTPPVQFDAAELGLPAFGYNIVNDDLEYALARATANTPGLGIVPGHVDRFHFDRDDATVEIEGHGTVRARVIIAADGRHSLARKSARIGVQARAWPQTALTALLRHDAPHHETSVEFHTRQGPFTLVPLPPSADGAFRSSLVWVMAPDEARQRRGSPADFARAAEQQSQRLYGRMTPDSDIGAFPIATSVSSRLTAPRLILAGEAAHALPPIGAQGLNLSFRDVAALVDTLRTARRRGDDIGGEDTLARYARVRRGDVALRSLGVDLLNGSLLRRTMLADMVRGGGLTALGAIGPLRRFVMRQGLVPTALGTGESIAGAGRLEAALDGRERFRRSTPL